MVKPLHTSDLSAWRRTEVFAHKGLPYLWVGVHDEKPGKGIELPIAGKSGWIFWWNIDGTSEVGRLRAVLGRGMLGVARAVGNSQKVRVLPGPQFIVALWVEADWLEERVRNSTLNPTGRTTGEEESEWRTRPIAGGILPHLRALSGEIEEPFLCEARLLRLVAEGWQAVQRSTAASRQQRVQAERVERVRKILAVEYEAPPDLTELGRRVGCSPFYLSRLFARETGQTISQFLRDVRLAKAKELLDHGEMNVSEAAVSVGYSSLSHFSRAFSTHFGHCPCHVALKSNAGPGGDPADRTVKKSPAFVPFL